jgi:hypothetical protein
MNATTIYQSRPLKASFPQPARFRCRALSSPTGENGAARRRYNVTGNGLRSLVRGPHRWAMAAARIRAHAIEPTKVPSRGIMKDGPFRLVAL